jgi:serine/threonine protein kinase
LDGRVKIVDFGLARTIAAPGPALTRTGAALGTPGYMPPEQLRGQALDARADVFSFGVMAYELATGVHPFGGNDAAALLERVLSDDPPLARQLEPPALGAIVRRSVRGNPLDRYQSGAELVAALRQLRTESREVVTAPLARTAWWWQFHQVAVPIITIIAMFIIGFRRHWLDPYGSAAMIGTLITGTVSVTLRLHLWFTSLVHPATLREIRARSLKAVMISEALLIAILTAAGVTFIGPHDAAGAWLIVTSLLLLLSLLVIEPSTTRASLDQ